MGKHYRIATKPGDDGYVEPIDTEDTFWSITVAAITVAAVVVTLVFLLVASVISALT